jgi:tetratricopeptide (TPR) repeat protein
MALVALVALAVYANSLGGDFVYDDQKQIVDNHLLRDASGVGRALRSDVWAFKGQSAEPWSNYWRPTFVLFLAAGYRLFGVESSVGWHLAVVALHALVTVLAFRLVRRLGGAPAVGFAVALLFAVHPVHVESVAWVSGAPDPLMAAALLGALLALLPARREGGPELGGAESDGRELGGSEPGGPELGGNDLGGTELGGVEGPPPAAARPGTPGLGAPSLGRWVAALALFAVALGAKEAAVTFPLLVALVWLLPGEGGPRAIGGTATSRQGGSPEAGAPATLPVSRTSAPMLGESPEAGSPSTLPVSGTAAPDRGVSPEAGAPATPPPTESQERGGPMGATAPATRISLATQILRRRLLRASLAALPFAVVAALWLAARHAVLGRLEIDTPWRLGLGGLLLQVPRVLAFYLGQALAPVRLGPSYPLRVSDEVGAAGFWLPLALVAAVAAGWLWLARRDRLAALGGGLFLLPLAPAFNLDAFLPEQIVHDRYLYLPVLGVAMTVVAAVARAGAGISRRLGAAGGGRAAASRTVADPWTPRAAGATLALAVAVLLSLPLGWQTVRYNRAWGSELALWERAVATDPGSSYNLAHLGLALERAGRTAEAGRALDRALAIAPVTAALLGRAEIAIREGRLDDARRDLELVLADQPDNPLVYERLAVIHQAAGRLREAERALRTGRERAPHRRCSLTVNLAVVLYMLGEKDRAAAELGTVGALAAGEPTASCLRGLYLLGSLHAERGEAAAARAAFGDYLERTAGLPDPGVRALREQAAAALGIPLTPR